jgi:hypothetical protein
MVVISRKTARTILEVLHGKEIDEETKRGIIDELIDGIRDSLELTDADVSIPVADAKALIQDYTSQVLEAIQSQTPDEFSYRQKTIIKEILDDVEDELLTILDSYREEEDEDE